MQVLNERLLADGRVRWQARVGEDRKRLEVVAIVPASSEPTEVALLSDAELRELLGSESSADATHWQCQECGALNARGRRWCVVCSMHDAG